MTKFLLISVLILSQLSAQQESTTIPAAKPADEVSWLNLGLGFGAPGIAVSIDFNSSFKNNRINQYNFNFNEEFMLIGNTPPESVSSLAFLTGRYSKSKNWMTAFLGGAGIVTGYRRGDLISSGQGWFSPSEYKKDRFMALGVMGNFQVFFTPFSGLGIGLELFACLNPEVPNVSVLFSLQLGG
ncbi:MAG: hypothetical protein HQ510_12915 [Candidatus Marinimicrobia bacterium]|nr:hypothetical protein [Candidatus Neomarinimicrobiota bacterium]